MQPADSRYKPGPAPNRGAIPAPVLPAKPPSSGLLKVGITANIDDINQRVQEITDGHQRLFGHQPSPGLVYDIVRGWSQNKVPDISTLFTIPTSQQEAQARQLATQPPDPKVAAKAKLAATVTAYTGAPMAIQRLAAARARQYEDPSYQIPPELFKQASMLPGFKYGIGGKGIAQIVDSLVAFIPGVYNMGKAATLDARDFAIRVESPFLKPLGWSPPVPKKDIHADRLQKLGVAMAKQTKRDFTTTDNWGYALMDTWAILSAGTGVGARVGSAAGRAGEVAGRVGRVEQALQATEGFRKPDLHAGFDIGYGSYTETVPAFQNAALRIMQGAYLKKAQGDLLARQLGDGSEFGARGNLVQDLLSTENLLNRQRIARNNIEYAIATAPLVEMSRLNSWSARARSAFEILKEDPSLFRNLKGISAEQKFGIDKAITLIFTDSHDPISAWRSHHDRQIADIKEQQADFHLQTAERAQALRETHDFHRQNAEDLKAQAKELEAGTITTMPTYTKGLAGYAVPPASVRNIARELTTNGFGEETIPVRESKSGRMVIQGERGHKLHAAAKAAGIEDIPVKITTASREQLAALRQAAREQAIIANKIKPDVKKAEDVMGLSAKNRERAAAEFEYRIAQHEGQLQAIDLAVKILADPPKRFQAVVDRAYEISHLQQEMKEIVYGLDPEIADQHLAEIHAILNGEEVRPLLDEEGKNTGRLGRVIPGIVSDEKLRNDVRAATQRVRAERKKLETQQIRLNRPTAKGEKAGDRPKVRAAVEEAQKRVVAAEVDLRHRIKAHETQGSRVIPLLRDVAEGDHIFGAPVYANHHTGETFVGRPHQHHEDLIPTLAAGDAPLWQKMNRLSNEGWHQGYAITENGTFSHVNWDGESIDSRLAPHEDKIVEAIKKSLADVSAIGQARAGRGSAYSGRMEREIYRDAGAVAGGIPKGRKGRFGRRPPKDETTATVRMTGSALEIGDYRWDTSRLLSEDLKNVTRGAFAMVHYHDLWHVGVKEKISSYHMPIRDIQSVPANLRKVIRALESHVIEPDAATLLSEENLQKLRDWLYPDESKLDTTDPHVRWVDERTVMNRFAGQETDWQAIDNFMNKALGPINDPWRFLVIFASPAYLMNAGGAAVTLAVEHGFASPGLFGRAIGAKKIWSPEVARMIDQLAGSTHAAALVSEKNPGKLSLGTQKFAQFWQIYTDRAFRRAAVIGELYKRGLIHDGMDAAEVREVLNDGLFPMTAKLRKEGSMDVEDARMRLQRGKDVIEAARVGRKQMLDFDKMSWPERAILRHVFFVYSFLRAGSIWSLRFIGEHPVKWAVSEQAGRDRKQQIEELIGKTPEWFYKGGYMPFDNNHVFNPMQFNMPGTLSSVAYSAQSLFSDAPYSNIGDTLGAAGILARDVFTGKTSSDKALPQVGFLPKGRITGSMLDLIEQTPPGYALQRQKKLEKQQGTKFPPPPVRLSENDPLGDASARERSMLKLNPFELDGFWNNWGRLIGRTAVPQTANDLAMQARYWRDVRAVNPEAYVQHQVDLVHEVVLRQAGVLGLKEIPVDVQNAVGLVAAREVYIEKWKQQKGIPQPGDRQLAVLTIGFLKKEGIIGGSKAKQYRNELAQAHGTSAWRGLWLKWLHENGTKAWADWTTRVNTVNFFNTDAYAPVANNLKDQSLGDFSKSLAAPNDVKWAYGRVFDAYLEERQGLQAQAKAAVSAPDRRVIEEQIRQLDNKHSDNVTVKGVEFPAPRAVIYGKLSPDQRASYLKSKSLSSWWTMNSFDRQLLTGKKPDSTVEKGYETLAVWMKEATDNLKPGEHLPSATRTYYANILAQRAVKAGNPAFLQDLQFAGILPKSDKTRTIVAERLQNLAPIQGSLYRTQWDYMLTQVSGVFHRAISDGWVTSSGAPNYSGINSLWTSYYLPKLQAWIDRQGPGFQKEVESYVTTHSKFLQDLIHHG